MSFHYGWTGFIFRLSANEYEHVADETLDSLTEVFEDIPERLDCDPEYDVTYNVSNTCVSHKQTAGSFVVILCYNDLTVLGIVLFLDFIYIQCHQKSSDKNRLPD